MGAGSIWKGLADLYVYLGPETLKIWGFGRMEYTEFENGWEGKKNHLTALRFARNYLVSLVSLILWQRTLERYGQIPTF